MTRKTALVAGGGVSGLAAAVFLDELGYEVSLLEKRPILGGRTYSFADKKTGLMIDNGQHLMIGAYHETFALLERIGAKSKVVVQAPSIVPLFNDKSVKASFKISALKPPLGLVAALVRYPGFSLTDKIGFLRLGLELNRIKSGKRELPKHLTVNDWLKKNGQTANAIKNFWEVLTLATLNDSPEIASADALATVLIKSYFAGACDGQLVFPKVSLNDLFVEPTVNYLKARGKEIITGLGVKEVRILNNRVQDIILTDGSKRHVDLFVSSLPPQRLLNILPAPFVEARSDLKVLSEFNYAPIVSVNLFYDKTVMEDVFAGSSGTRVHWFFNRNLIHNDVSFLQHIIGVVSGAYDLSEKSKEEIVALATSEFKQLYPKAASAKLVHALVNVERQATLSCPVGVNAKRPKQRILDNFFAVGDWTNTGLPPTIESAVVSARRMAEDLGG